MVPRPSLFIWFLNLIKSLGLIAFSARYDHVQYLKEILKSIAMVGMVFIAYETIYERYTGQVGFAYWVDDGKDLIDEF